MAPQCTALGLYVDPGPTIFAVTVPMPNLTNPNLRPTPSGDPNKLLTIMPLTLNLTLTNYLTRRMQKNIVVVLTINYFEP